MLNDALTISMKAIDSCRPQKGVAAVLHELDLHQPVYLVAVGKAAYAMAEAAAQILDIKRGIIITKYGHARGQIDKVEICEAGHPLSDVNGVKASEEVLKMCADLKADDIVIFLLSGGASALFEVPLIPLPELIALNDQFLKKGLDIHEINTIRKKLSMVKGGRFADHCAPAKVYGILLSDVLGDELDVIGSGPTVRDLSSADDALAIIDRYDLMVSDKTRQLIKTGEPAKAENATNRVIGSVKILCQQAMLEAEKLGYRPILLSDQLTGEAREAGDMLYGEILKHLHDGENVCLIMGGETTVTVRGRGLGGRNQELVFSQLQHLDGLDKVLIMSLGSDGTDGPCDAAGGYADGSSYQKVKDEFAKILADNDSYHGLQKCGGLIITGPTGTNVNDLTIALIRS